MSVWRGVNDPAPCSFIDILNAEGNDEETSGDEDSEWEIEDRENETPSPEGSPYSPLSSPEPCEKLPLNEGILGGRPYRRVTSPQSPRAASRDRSRSPLPPFSSESAPEGGVMLQIFDENGVLLDAIEEGVFLSPDTHPLYVSAGERDSDARTRDERSRRRTSGQRGGRRGVRGVRGQGARRGGYPHQGPRGGRQWALGHPLTEIWLDDADLPPELVSLATDVLRRRQQRMGDDGMFERMGERERNKEENDNDDEFFDAGAGGDALSALESDSVNFSWSSMETFHGKEEDFKPERTGSVYAFDTAYNAFRSYWSDDILGLIVHETNEYATKIASVAFQSDWFPTNTHEILCLFSFWMMLGIMKMPTINSCFSLDPLLKTEVFRRIFTRKRYHMLSRALHFVDSHQNPSNTSARSFDRLHRLRPIITHLNLAFQSNYVLGKDICIDESLTLWKGRLSFKQYIRNKASKFGIKTFELCESRTGYLWSFIVYTGKQSAADTDQSPGDLKSTAVVKKLIGPLLNKGYRLFMGNRNNSPRLARFLKLNGTDFVGTLRPFCRDVPFVINKAPLKRGEYIARHSGDVTVLSWQDNERITMISTCHGASSALPTVSSRPASRPVPFKPQVVLDYNKFMGGVDMKDQMLEPYLLGRKHCKENMKLFKRLLNVSILNSRILLQSSLDKHIDHLPFRTQLVDSILTNHLSLCPLIRHYDAPSRSIMPPRSFVANTHWPAFLEPTGNSSEQKRNFRKRCVVCLRQGMTHKKTTYCCESCRAPLCVPDCFKIYHTS